MTILPPLESVLVANRGEIAGRVIRTARRLGIRTVAVYSEADEGLPYVREADEAKCIGPARPQESYLNSDRILRAAVETGVAAIHPGYGFLSENARFAAAVGEAGLVWVGPEPGTIDAMGHKVNARNLMQRAGVPVAAGTDSVVSGSASVQAAAREIGFPLMVKAVAGGGGIGMAVVHDMEHLESAVESARSRAGRFFDDGDVFLERYIEGARHVEVQILGLADGEVIALGERECSVQRRHQKLVEETPSPGISQQLRSEMLAGAVRAGEAVGYKGTGTVECLVDPVRGDYVFLEMNTRLQVEHPITEMVTGVDLVEEQFRIAAGLPVSFDRYNLRVDGHAMEMRVYAEDPVRFLPSPGKILAWRPPDDPWVRVDQGYDEGCTVTPYYDPLLAKLCVHASDRDEMLERASKAVQSFAIEGLKVNLPFFGDLLQHPGFQSGDYNTTIVSQLRPKMAS